MSNNVAEMLAELRADHKNMTVLLNLLEQEANRLYDGREADYPGAQDTPVDKSRLSATTRFFLPLTT